MNNHETENDIVFHDEASQQNFNQEKGPKNKIGIASFVLVILSIIILFIPSEAIWLSILYDIVVLVGLVLSIVALVQIKKKNQSGKVYAVLGLVGVILSFVIMIVVGVAQIANMPEEEFNDMMYCPYVTDCVDNGDGISSCVYVDDSTVKCSTKLLKENQFQ